MKNKNITYEVELSQLKPELDKAQYEKCKFKELGYIVLHWWSGAKKYIKNYHGLLTPDSLKKLLGEKQYSKFCQGKRIFTIQ